MKIVIRVDADIQIGAGHILRCLALAQGWKNAEGEVVFISYCENDRLLERIRKEVIKVYTLQRIDDIETTRDILEKEKPDWVVFDGYHFGPEYQQVIKDSGYKLLVIDDYAHLKHYYADIILNQNYGSENFVYSAEPYTKLLLGTKYVLLRKEFLEYSDYKKQIPDVAQKVLITMGGGDNENNTFKVLQAINLIETPLDVRVIIGVINLHYTLIKKEADRSKHNIKILRNVEDMAPLMAWADVAVSAGGTTTWELAFMGLPAVLCIVANNQENAVTSLDKARIFYSAGWINDRKVEGIVQTMIPLIRSKSLREEMYVKEKEVVDGKGIERLLLEASKVDTSCP